MQSTQWLRAVVLAVFDSLLKRASTEFSVKKSLCARSPGTARDLLSKSGRCVAKINMVVTLAYVAKDILGESLHQNERKE